MISPLDEVEAAGTVCQWFLLLVCHIELGQSKTQRSAVIIIVRGSTLSVNEDILWKL